MAEPLRLTAADPLPPFYAGYAALAETDGLRALLAGQTADVRAAVDGLDGAHRYAPDKWDVAAVVGHLSDTERVFAYRLLRLLRQDPTPLPPFTQNAYAEAAGPATLAARLDEFAAVRAATLALVDLAPDAAWDFVGTVSGAQISARAMAVVIAGHVAHHVGILRERYRAGTVDAPAV